MEVLGMIGIVLGIIAIIYLSLKEINILIAAPIATLIVILFNQVDIFTTFMGPGIHHYMGALGGYIINFFALFLLGSILAKFMEESGATVTIANVILTKVGTDKPYRVLVALFVVSAILTYGGISIFVAMFAVIPLARSLFQKMNISWHLIQAPLWLGLCTITLTILPGTPAFQNVIPVRFLGTSLIAAPLPSVIAAIACSIWGLAYMRHCLQKSMKRGETYVGADVDKVSHKERQLPNFTASTTPLIILILLVFFGSISGSDFWKSNIIYVALTVAIVLSAILFRKQIPDKGATLSRGATASIPPVFATASAVGFGSVIMGLTSFAVFSEAILSLPGSPLVSLTVLTSAISGITGSASGALGIVMPTFANYYLEMGVHPDLVHRVAAIASNMTTVMPHGGVFLTFLALSGLNHRTGFKDSFITVFVGCAIALVIVIGLGNLFV